MKLEITVQNRLVQQLEATKHKNVGESKIQIGNVEKEYETVKSGLEVSKTMLQNT